MNFWQFLDAHPWWATLWLAMLMCCIPTVKFVWKSKAVDRAEERTSPGETKTG